MPTGQRKIGKNFGIYYYKSIISLLEVDLGQSMSESLLNQYCRELDIKTTAINESHIDFICQKLKISLQPFLEEDQLNLVLQQITSLKDFDDWGTI